MFPTTFVVCHLGLDRYKIYNLNRLGFKFNYLNKSSDCSLFLELIYCSTIFLP